MQVNMSDLDLGLPAEEIAQQSIEHYRQLLNNINFTDEQLSQCSKLMQRLINQYDLYTSLTDPKKNNLRSDIMRARCELQIDLIYKDFFALQDYLNNLLGQQIIITGVIVSSNLQREIHLSSNTIQGIAIQSYTSFFGKTYQKLTYQLQSMKHDLDNLLPSNYSYVNNLQQTVAEITERYYQYHRIVLWHLNSTWDGYRLTSLSAVNEAFANFYLNTVPFPYIYDAGIYVFMKHRQYGAIVADNTKGLLIGDVHNNNFSLQFAVKGKKASPQGFKQACKEIKVLLDQGLTNETLKDFLKHYTINELEKKYKPHIKELTQQELKKTMRIMTRLGY